MERKITAKVSKVIRQSNTRSANPRWRFDLTNGEHYFTKPDAMVAYDVTGAEAGKMLNLTIGERRQITHFEIA